MVVRVDYVRTYGGGSQSMGRMILRKVYGPKGDTNRWRIRTNKELQDQYKSADILTSIKVRRLEWAGHVVRMDDERVVKTVFLGNPGGRRKPGRPRLRCLDYAEDDLKTLGVRRWRKRAEDREKLAIVLKEAMVKL
jgi:hypothetical protein